MQTKTRAKSKRQVRHWKQLTDKDFKNIKEALQSYKNSRSPVGAVSRLTGRTWNTVQLISQCNSIEEFRAAQNARRELYKKPKEGMDAILEAANNMPDQAEDLNIASSDVVELLQNIYLEIRLLRKDLASERKATPERRGIFSRS